MPFRGLKRLLVGTPIPTTLAKHERLSRVTPVKLEPSVAVRPEASPSATVIEVRTADRPGLIPSRNCCAG